MISHRGCVIMLFLLIIKFECASTCMSSAPEECPKTFCKCQKKSNGKAVCSGRSLNYIPRLPKYIRSVIFTNTSIRVIDKCGLVNLTFHQIEKINFTGNDLHSIDKDAFLNLTFLASLIVSSEPHLNVSVLKLSFQSFPRNKLSELRLTFNHWKSLPRDMFNNAHVSNVRHLFLQANSFTYFNFTTFKSMTRLRDISLSNNSISHVSLTKLTSLTKLDMSSNQLSKVPTFCGRNNTSFFPYLNIIILSRNKIGFLGLKSFHCLPRLSKLYLDYTYIGRLQDNVFASLPSLRTLHLLKTGNPLRFISQNAFNSSSLETLILQGSHFRFDKQGRYIANRIFASCPNLQHLDLTDNYMTSDESTFQTIFRPLRKLQKLFLSSTRIVSLPTNVFTHMKLLQELHLNNNGINFWNNSYRIFGNMTSMKFLNLKQNYISVINETSFPDDLLSRLEVLNLARNPFSCICDQMWFRNWIQQNGSILKEYPNQYKCRHPNNMNGIVLRDYKPTVKMCNPWNPLYTIAIVMGMVVLSFIAVGSIAAKCQGNIKNYIYLLRVYHNRKQGYIPLDSEEDYEYHAFVVYCDNDRKWVHNDLLNKLENEEGLQLCIHHRNFIVGDSISVNVDNFLKKSWKVLVIVSNNFAQSEWCQWEVDVVQERRRRQGKEVIVPIILDTIDSKHMTSQLRTLLDSTPSLRYRAGVGSELFWKVLLESLRKPLGHPPTSLLYSGINHPSFNGQTRVSPETEPPTW
ncbi:toll-like receptor 6 [Mytilus galloprovincialis]|uniref:toll-like receptor 6 n=1 Tax=Mytilus galloprovincialis TaxID=29158 RepID=UPI003F7BD60E